METSNLRIEGCCNGSCDRTISTCKKNKESCALAVVKIIDDSERAIETQQELILSYLEAVGKFDNDTVGAWIASYAKKFREIWEETKDVMEIKSRLYSVN